MKFVAEIGHENASTLYTYHSAVQLVLCGGLLGGMQTCLGIIIFV